MAFNLLNDAIEQANAANQPGLILALLPEDVVWVNADALLSGESKYLAIILVRGIDQAFDLITDKRSAAAFLNKTLQPELGSLLYEATVSAILNQAATWDKQEAETFYDILETSYRRYLQDTQGGDAFIARSALEGLVLLPLYRQDKRLLLSAQSILVNRFPPLPSTPDELDYLAVRAVQLLGRCYDVDPQPVIADKIKELTLAHNPEVATEAYYNLGTVYLNDAFRVESALELQTKLQQARNAFEDAIQSYENRTDAEVLLAVTQCYLAALEANGLELSRFLEQASAKLVQRILMLGETSPVEEATRFYLIQLLVSLKQWVETLTEATGWPSIYPPMEILAAAYTAIRELDFSGDLVAYAGQTTQHLIMLPQLQSRFLQVQEMKTKLERALATPNWRKTPPSTVAFYELALELIEGTQDQKNDIAARWLSHLAAIEPDDPFLAQRIRQIIEAGGYDSAVILTEILSRYSEQKRWLDRFLLAGPAKTIYQRLRMELVSKLNWPAGSLKWFYLEYVIAGVCHYFVETNKLRVPDAQFLFAASVGGLGKKARERHLQDHFYSKMHMALGVKLHYEPDQITPGRPDLAFICPDDVIFPIEVKCEKKDISHLNIQHKYVAQSQHFAAALEQVGFLFVLDTTPKSSRPPAKYSLEYCYLDSYDVPSAQDPVWVIVVIFEANRYRPSDHTNLPDDA